MRTDRLALGLWLLLLAVCAVIDASSVYRTKMGDFLPHSASLAQRVLARQVNGGAASHILLVSLHGAPTATLATLSEGLAKRLRQNPAFIDVLNGDAQSLAPIQNFIWKNRYLLSPTVTSGRFSAPSLHSSLTGDLGLLATDLAPMLSHSIPADPTQEIMSVMDLLKPAGRGPEQMDGVWTSPHGTAALLLLHTAAPGFDLNAQQRDLQTLDAMFSRIRAKTRGAQMVRLEVTGPGVFGVRTRAVIKDDVTLLSSVAITAIVLLLLYVYRSPRMLLLGILPIVSGAITAIAAVSLVFGFVHGITLGFGITLMGEAMDYTIYLFTQTARDGSAQGTIRRIWPTLRLGALTSVVGFSAMLASSFTGFAQLGLFSIVGLVTAAGVTRFVLPPLVPVQFFAEGAERIARPMEWLIRNRRSARPVAVVVLLGAIAALLNHQGTMWDQNLLDLSPIPASAQSLDTRLRHELGIHGQRYFAVFQAVSAQQALDKSGNLAPVLAGLKTSGLIAAYDLPSTILPSSATQRARQAALPNAAILKSHLDQALAGLPFRSGVFSPFLKDVELARTAPLLTPANLPPALALRFNSMLVRNGSGWVVIAPLRGVSDPTVVKQRLGTAGADFVDLGHQTGVLMATFQHEAVMLATFGSLAILVVLLAGLRSLRRALTVALPLAAAVTITAALLTTNGGKLSIFMVMGFMLIVATGSNYCLFFERAIPGSPFWDRAIASIVLANLCTVGAYGLLALSRIPVLHDIGLTVAAGTFLSLVCGALFSLPPDRMRTP